MHVQFITIAAVNFRSFERFVLNLREPGVTLVQGKIEGGSETLESNGAGKSSIFSAVSWALFGKFPHVSGQKVSGDKVVRRGASGGCYVAVEFQIAETIYRVTRYRLDPLHGDKLVLVVNGLDGTQATNQRTQQFIEQILGISFELFVNLIFVTEATIKESFAFETDANRKKMLVSALPQFQKFGKARTKVKDSLTQFNGFARKLQMEQDAFSTAAEEVNGEVLPNTKQINNRITQLLNEVEVLNTDTKIKESEIAEVELSLSSLDSTPFDVELKEAQDQIEDRRQELSTFKVQKSSAESGFKKWDAMEAQCPTCGHPIAHSEKIQHAQTFKDKTQELVMHVLAAELSLEELRKIKQNVDRNITELRRLRELLHERKGDAERTIGTNASTTTAKLSEVEQLRSILKNLDTVKKLREEKKQTLQDRLDEIRQTLSVVKNFESSLTVWLDGYGPRGVLSLALNHVVDVLTLKTRTWLENLWHEGASLSFEFTGDDLSKIESRLSVNRSLVDLESLSSGETRRLCLALCFGLRDSLQELTGWKSNLLILDEVFDGLDGVGRTKVLSELKQLTDLSVFVISQFPQLSEDIDRVARVTFSNNVSTLEILSEN